MLINFDIHFSLILHWLWEAFGSHVGPKSHQKATQNACKILIDFDIDFSSIFHRFWMGFGRLLGAILASKMLPRCIKNCTPILNDFLIDFSSIFNGFLIHVGSSEPPKVWYVLHFWHFFEIHSFHSISWCKMLQNCLKYTNMLQHSPNIAPTWPNMSLTWAQHEPK